MHGFRGGFLHRFKTGGRFFGLGGFLVVQGFFRGDGGSRTHGGGLRHLEGVGFLFGFFFLNHLVQHVFFRFGRQFFEQRVFGGFIGRRRAGSRFGVFVFGGFQGVV